MKREQTCLLLLLVLLGTSSPSVSAWKPWTGLLEATARIGRKLLQGSSEIIPVVLDTKPCATLNADDAAPVLDKDNTTLGWSTLQQGGVDSSGVVTMQLDVTTHVAGYFLADTATTQADFSNARLYLFTQPPTSCPMTTQAAYTKAISADCEKKRATISITIPRSIFNCTYSATAQPWNRTLYVQVAVDLAEDVCLSPLDTYFSGSRRPDRLTTPGCSYIAVQATCTPSTCDAPALSAAELAALNPPSEDTKSYMPIILGSTIGVGVVIAAIIGGVLFVRKRQRDEAMRIKLGLDGELSSEFGSDNEEEDADFDFSAKSTAFGARASMFMGRSALFSRTHKSTAGGRHGSVSMPDGSPVSYLPTPSYAPGDRRGGARFSDKYTGAGGDTGAGPSNFNPMYGVRSSGGGAAEGGAIGHNEIELHEDNYSLSRMSSKMPYGMPLLPRPAPAVTVSQGRSIGQVAAELGLMSPAGNVANDMLEHNPELVPENASAFVNPLAMLDDSDNSDGEIGGAGGGGGLARVSRGTAAMRMPAPSRRTLAAAVEAAAQLGEIEDGTPTESLASRRQRGSMMAEPSMTWASESLPPVRHEALMSPRGQGGPGTLMIPTYASSQAFSPQGGDPRYPGQRQ